MLSRNYELSSMGVGASLYMCDVHVRYLISWWVLVWIRQK